MEPITLIATALAAGAAAGVQDTASASVRSAYARLVQLVRSRLGGRSAELDGAVEAQRTADASAPGEVVPELRRLLVSVEAGQDHHLRSLADVVLRQLPGATAHASGHDGWNVWISDCNGVHNGSGPQHNTFHG
ncbi:hypothetical protein ACWD0J_34040 [Streptomyces sp. NPDC003011]